MEWLRKLCEAIHGGSSTVLPTSTSTSTSTTSATDSAAETKTPE